MKSPHAAVLGLHVGQVERIMRRRHAVDQTLPPVYPEKLRILTVASYPQHIHSLKNESSGRFNSDLLRTNSQA
jgi:hypothetical protein